ncbi:MAG: hypothetical protein U1E51_12815 [Candidatus Binatia bacterium]|nr:hypothetical protein [Candidatus Binatia bacterium]
MATARKTDISKVSIYAAILLAVIALALGAAYMWKSPSKPYYAVLLANDDLYFAQVSYFPRMTLTNPYTLQAVNDPETGESSLQIVPLSVSIWAPERLVINPDQVVSVSKIGEGSQILNLIESDQAGMPAQ